MSIKKSLLPFLLVVGMLCSLILFTAVTTSAADEYLKPDSDNLNTELNIRNDIPMTRSKAETIFKSAFPNSFITNINPFFVEGQYIFDTDDFEDYSDVASNIKSNKVYKFDWKEAFPILTCDYYILYDKGEPADFNQDTGKAFIGLAYQKLNNRPYWTRNYWSVFLNPDNFYYSYRFAITDIITSSTPALTIEHNGIVYQRAYGLMAYQEGISGFGTINMNNANGGDDIFLYYTRDARAGNPITDLFFQGGDGHKYDLVVCNVNGEVQNFNANSGIFDDPCYLWFDRLEYSKSEVASAMKTLGNALEPVTYQSPVIDNTVLVGFEEKVCNSYSDVKESVYGAVTNPGVTEEGRYWDYRDGRGYSALWGIDGQDTWYVASGEVTVPDSVAVFGNVHLILADGCNLTVNSGGGSGIKVPVGCSLTIYGQSGGTGSLTVNGGSDGAGIGCDEGHGAIVINGGNITATGGSNGAGIGGSKNSDGGNLTVNGGTVIATGGSGAAGIGGGFGGEGHNVVINSGTVTATGNTVAGMAMGGAGIGGGSGSDTTGGGNGRNIVIHGGAVTATGGAGGAGIGGGSYSGNGYYIDINGGTVSAYGSTNAAGIGGGWGGNGTDIGIGGGTVNAFGGEGGTGIGGGYAGTACNISIGSAAVLAKAGNTHDTAIGCGLESVTPASNITISTDMQIKNEDTSDVISNNGEDMASTLSGIQNLSVSENAQTGSVFTNVNSVFLIAGIVLLLIAIGAVFVISKKKKNNT